VDGSRIWIGIDETGCNLHLELVQYCDGQTDNYDERAQPIALQRWREAVTVRTYICQKQNRENKKVEEKTRDKIWSVFSNQAQAKMKLKLYMVMGVSKSPDVTIVSS